MVAPRTAAEHRISRWVDRMAAEGLTVAAARAAGGRAAAIAAEVLVGGATARLVGPLLLFFASALLSLVVVWGPARIFRFGPDIVRHLGVVAVGMASPDRRGQPGEVERIVI